MTQEGNFRVSICPVATENEEENPWKINGPKERVSLSSALIYK